jgi:sirohydrochlorin cobaltochelatase
MDGKKGILVVSFGTSFDETRKLTIEACEKQIAAEFTDYEVRRAFTSHMIIKILKERGLNIDKPEEALEKMYRDGFSEVIVQPLHIIPGEEFHEKILKNVAKYEEAFEKIEVGRPMLTYTDDYYETVDAVKDQLPVLNDGDAVVFMGHGTHHPANACYTMLQRAFDREGLSVYVGTVEGFPTLDDILPALKADAVRKVTLMPFMIVAGDHASNDMAGDEEDSWKTILKKEGFDVEIYLHGLGENKRIQAKYVHHVKDAIEGTEGSGH